MQRSSIRRIFCFAVSFLLTFTGGIAHADDTEIYFNTGANINVPIRPNVLLILDSSGSMSATVSGTGKTRMQLMKEAMVEIINNMQEVNVGLMRFTNDDGGPVLFPVSFIDAPAASVVSEPDDTQPTFVYGISSGFDDAEEILSTGAVSTGNPVLSVAQTLSGGSGNFTQQVSASQNDADEFFGNADTTTWFWVDAGGNTHDGARFSGVTIPQGATITSATFSLHRAFGSGGSTNFSGHAVDNSPPFSSGGPDISSRTKTAATVNRQFADTDPEEIEINTIIQEIVNRPGWSSGNALSIISHTSTGQRRFHSFDTNAGKAPQLSVDYVSGGTSEDQLVGLRFSSVDIPQGAVITGAKLILTATSSQSDPAGPQWQIKAENAGDAAAYSGTNGDISGRPTTGASVTWDVPDTTADLPVNSPELKTLVQEVVDRADWCGGNAMAFVIEKLSADSTRLFHSFEGNPAFAPQLQVSYDVTAGTPGCFRKTIISQIAVGNDDAEETSSGGMQRTSSDLDISQKHVGLRFTNLEIPQGSTILSAILEVNAEGNSTSGSPAVTIRGEDVDSSSQFTSSTNDLTNRSTTSAGESWTLGNYGPDGTWHASPDISSVIQEIVNRSGWAQGNALSLILDMNTNNRRAKSFERSATQAPRLTVTYESTAGASAVKTVRQRLVELVNDIPVTDWTPIVETFFEAARYWRGGEAVFGTTRDDSTSAGLSHPGSYCTENEDGSLNCNGADIASFPPFGVELESGCDPDSEWNTFDCDDSFIRGGPDYISPFSSDLTCQSNYQVLLTDGEANRNEIASTIESEFLGGSSCQATKSDGSSVTSGERCGIDLVEFMVENDQSTSLDNDQTVRTYTIGFNTSSLANATQFLTDLADVGDGKFFEATDASDLVNVFNVILNDVKSDPTSFVSPSLATNAFNRLLSRDEIYFGLFTPSFERSWPGNVKKYNICVDSSDLDGDGQPDCTLGEILDVNGVSAIDDVTNKFKDSSTSHWTLPTVAPDGKETVRGGAGGTLTDYTQRILYTDATPTGVAPAAGTSLDVSDNPGHQIDIDTWDDAETAHIRDQVCPTPDTAPGSECENIMKWMLGKIIEAEPESDTSATTRWTVNDVLHSSPSVVTYGGTDTDADGVIDSFFDRILVGTNEGGLRFINGITGEEEWIFIPQEMLPSQRSHFDNTEGEHMYGLDLTPALRARDNNKDGVIDPDDGDFVQVFAGMRRGGNFLYALDITPEDALPDNDTDIPPKFLWRINQSSPGFGRLADTWSRPLISRISINTGPGTFTSKEVLIFGGGYDSALDTGFGTAPTGGNDNLGNALYIVDPDNGNLIMSVSGSGSGASIEVPEMRYSIASRITALDTQGDGLADRLYFGDTRGQVWRVDLGDDIKLSGPDAAGSTVVGRLADIAVPGGSPPVDERRFFEPPAVVQVVDTVYSDAASGEFDYVLIGSGNRPNPLNKTVRERFYAFRDKFTGKLPDSNNNNLADAGYPIPSGPITDADMVDVTTTTLDSNDTTHVQSSGWFFDFDNSGSDGEKVLSAPTAIAGGVFLTTYIPDVVLTADLCAANIGGGNAYNFNILNARAVIDWDEDGTLEDLADRVKALGGGIPSDVVPVFTKEGVLGIVGIEGGAAQLGALSGLPRFRTYWYEEN